MVSRRNALELLACGIFLPLRATVNAAPAPALDPQGLLRPALAQAALRALDAHAVAERARMAVVDFKLHSSKPRFYLVDLKTGAVDALRCAHGLGSDKEHDGFAKIFSNKPGSGASSLGAYKVAGLGAGPKHGPHLALDGLEASNDQARTRAIILHSAWYAEDNFIAQWGKMGRSNGCFVTSNANRDALFKALPAGSLLYAGA